MKAHQRVIRERHALEFDPLRDEKMRAAASFDNATVREISRQEAETVIIKYEWLGNMGASRYYVGLFFENYLAGVACFGMTAGTKTAESVCGKEYSAYIITLTRGACVHWAHPNSASYLIPRACRLMKEKYGFHVFVAYSDAEAGEVGTVYQASNWLYCGQTNGASSMFVWPGRPDPARGVFYDGKPRDEQNIFKATRTRTSPGRPYHVHCSRREKHRELIRSGFVFYRTKPKHRYVTLCGSTEVVQELRAALRWKVSPYPRRTGGA